MLVVFPMSAQICLLGATSNVEILDYISGKERVNGAMYGVVLGGVRGRIDHIPRQVIMICRPYKVCYLLNPYWSTEPR